MFDAAREMVIASAPSGLSESEFKSWLFERIYGCTLAEAIAGEANTSDARAFGEEK